MKIKPNFDLEDDFEEFVDEEKIINGEVKCIQKKT